MNRIYGRIEIDPRRFFVHVGKKRHRLSMAEFRVLEALVAAEGHVMSRAELCRKAQIKGEQSIDVHVARIRKAIGQSSILTLSTVGYQVAP